MQTYKQLLAANPDRHFWSCNGRRIDGHNCFDVLVYESEEDLDRDTGDSLALYRVTVIDDIYA